MFNTTFNFCKIKGYCFWKCKFYTLCILNPTSGLLQFVHKLIKWQWYRNLWTFCHRQVFLTLSCLVFLSLVTGPSFISISLPVLELSQFSFIKDWPEIWKLEIPSFEYCLISRYWGKVGIAHLVWIFLITCYWMMQNVKITVFAVVKLLREKHRNSWMNL